MTDQLREPRSAGSWTTSEVHWDSIYERSRPDELGWYEPVPSTLPLVLAHSQPTDSVVDIGGGASGLAGELLDRGYDDLTVLDLSETALTRARHGLGSRARQVEWLRVDVTRYVPSRQWRVWHDRAVFHFLVDRGDRVAYRRAAASAVAPGGVIVLATFAPDGPETCAGLPVRRYDQLGLASEFADDFVLVDGASLRPASEVGDQRPYVAVVLRRRS